MNGIEVGRISSVDGVEIRPMSRSILRFSTELINEQVQKWWLTHLSNGERTKLEVKARMLFDLGLTRHEYPVVIERSFRTSLLSGFNFRSRSESGSESGSGNGNVAISVSDVSTHFGSVSANDTEVITTAVVTNGGTEPVELTGYRYTLQIGGYSVGAVEMKTSEVVLPGTGATVRFVLPLRTGGERIARWWVQHLERGEKTEMKQIIQVQMDIGESDHSHSHRYMWIEGEKEFRTSLLRELLSPGL